MNRSPDLSELAVFRPEYLLEITNNDRKMFERFVEVFLKNCPEMVKRISEGHRTGNLEELRRAAHTLCGSAGSFGADRLRVVAGELDAVCREDTLNQVPALVDRVLEEWRLLREEIDRVLSEPG